MNKHRYPLVRFAVSLFVCFALSQCSATKQGTAPTIDSPPKKEVLAQPVSPFSLQIVEDLNDGSNLHIHGRVESATIWPADDVVVRLTGMKSGQAQKPAFYPLSDLQQKRADSKPADKITPGAPFDFYLSVPASDLTDYQLELLWGKEAKGVTPKVSETVPESGGVVLQGLSVQRLIPNCAAEPCPSTYKLSGSVFNGSAAIVQDVVLGVGFVWVPKAAKLDLSAQIPQDEENVEITGLNLASQQARSFKLSIDRVVPELPEGSFQPVVRIISSRTQSK